MSASMSTINHMRITPSGFVLSTAGHRHGDASHLYNLLDPIIITDDNWVMEAVASLPRVALSQLPLALLVDSIVASAAGKKSIAFATNSELFIMHFPDVVFQNIFTLPDHTMEDTDGLDEYSSEEDGYMTADENLHGQDMT